MVCKFCGNEMYITGSRIRVEGDNSPDTQTKVWRVLSFRCKNPRCGHKDEEREEEIRLD